MPMSAVDVGRTVIVGRVPPPAVMGAVQTLISVASEAAKWSSSTYWLPAESTTLAAVDLALLHIPTSTTKRSPEVTFAAGVTARLATARVCAKTCCTNAGATLALGVTAFEGEDAGPGPIALLAATVKVYVVPFTKPVIVTLVAGGEPETVVAVWAVVPIKGVTV
jgi:hypothetical protein